MGFSRAALGNTLASGVSAGSERSLHDGLDEQMRGSVEWEHLKLRGPYGSTGSLQRRGLPLCHQKQTTGWSVWLTGEGGSNAYTWLLAHRSAFLLVSPAP